MFDIERFEASSRKNGMRYWYAHEFMTELGYENWNTFKGVIKNYIPDFLIRLDNGTMLVLETKGQAGAEVDAKRKALAEWIKAVNNTHEYGHWVSDISYNIKDVDEIISKYV